MKNTYKVEVTYSFTGEYEIKADNEDQAKEYARTHCGCVLSGNNPHSSLPDDMVSWEFPVHGEEIINEPIKID